MKVTELETPAVVVDLDVLEQNLRRLTGYAGKHGLKVRPHTKTHKIPAIAKMQMQSGCHGVTVAKSCEAVVMAAGGLDNILVAYPVFGEAKVTRLAELARDRQITVAVDSLITAEGLSHAAQKAGSTIHLLVEMDVGMRRCGVPSPESALSLAASIAKLSSRSVRGPNLLSGAHLESPGRTNGCTASRFREDRRGAQPFVSRRLSMRDRERRKHADSFQ